MTMWRCSVCEVGRGCDGETLPGDEGMGVSEAESGVGSEDERGRWVMGDVVS